MADFKTTTESILETLHDRTEGWMYDHNLYNIDRTIVLATAIVIVLDNDDSYRFGADGVILLVDGDEPHVVGELPIIPTLLNIERTFAIVIDGGNYGDCYERSTDLNELKALADELVNDARDGALPDAESIYIFECAYDEYYDHMWPNSDYDASYVRYVDPTNEFEIRRSAREAADAAKVQKRADRREARLNKKYAAYNDFISR